MITAKRTEYLKAVKFPDAATTRPKPSDTAAIASIATVASLNCTSRFACLHSSGMGGKSEDCIPRVLCQAAESFARVCDCRGSVADCVADRPDAVFVQRVDGTRSENSDDSTAERTY